MSKFSKNARKAFHFLTGQRRIRKLEARIKALEEHFTVTISYYEQKIDTLINSVARALPQEANHATSQSVEENVLVFAHRSDNSKNDHDERAQPSR